MQQVSSFVSLVKRGLLPFRICWSKRRQLTLAQTISSSGLATRDVLTPLLQSAIGYSWTMFNCRSAQQKVLYTIRLLLWDLDLTAIPINGRLFEGLVHALFHMATHSESSPQAQVSVPSSSIVWCPDARVGAKVQEVVLRNRLAFEIVSRSSREYDQVLAFRWQTSPRGRSLGFLQYWGTIWATHLWAIKKHVQVRSV